MLSKNQIKKIQSLHLKKNRIEKNQFIAEGPKLAEEILQSSIEVLEIFAVDSWLNKNAHLSKGKSIEVDQEDLKKISTLSTPNEVLLICATPMHELNYERIGAELTLYLDDVRDPGNLGTIIRVCDWFGVAQIICSSGTTEVYSPKTIQSSMGSITRVKAITADIADVLKELSEYKKEVLVYGAMLEGENLYQKKELESGILVIGNESNGISQNVGKLLTHRIKIPSSSKNGAESLNAAIATSLVVAEFFRQKEYC